MCSEYKSFIRYMICSFSLRKGLGQSRGNGHREGSSYLASDPAIHSFSASGMCGSGSASRLPRSEGPLAKPQEQEAHLATHRVATHSVRHQRLLSHALAGSVSPSQVWGC